jgi:hypothetical protein
LHSAGVRVAGETGGGGGVEGFGDVAGAEDGVVGEGDVVVEVGDVECSLTRLVPLFP